MGLMAGSKQTQVGRIPLQWDVWPLGDLAEITTGSTPPTSDASNYGDEFLFVSPGDLGANKYIRNTEKLLSKKGFAISRRFPKDSVLFVCIGSTIGKCGIATKELTSNQQINAVLPSSALSSPYLYYALAEAASRIRYQAGEQAVPMHNNTQLAGTVLALPPTKAEQDASAGALSDTDALIEALEQLFTKKRQIKQGAMQQLLTGETRLPGFEGEWESRTFDDLFEYCSTATNSRADLVAEGEAYYVHYGDIHTKFHAHLDFRRDRPPMIDRHRCRNATRLRNGDWVMADASEDFDGIGKAIEILGLPEGVDAVAGLHTFLLRERSETYVPGFKGHLGGLESLHQEFLRVATGMKVFGVSKAALRDLLLPVPPPSEQTAIATILSDMDAEIAALEAKLAKTRLLKQGMMRELLTGRIRLV